MLRAKKDPSINPLNLLAEYLSNDFECALLPEYPDVDKVYRMIIAAGAVRTLLCGSGLAVFGLARDRAHAAQMADILVGHFYFVTTITSSSKD